MADDKSITWSELEDSKIEKINYLARTVSVLSGQSDIEGSNPFTGATADESLNPLSGKFSYEKWIRIVLAITSRDPDQYPTRTAGISFSSLNAYGYASESADCQKTVGNVLLEIPSKIAGLFGREGKGRKVDIFRNFEGVVRPGEMLLVLGPPGSGCTTLLKTIAGETDGFFINDDAKINYQGIPKETMHKDFRGEVVYNAENDVHFPNLTVGQTLQFAARARTPRARLPGVTREQWADHMRDVVMAVFGLSHTLNTKVGNDFIRGVSGGERKRVSIAEATLSGSPLQCWDNSTRGLDSATALEFVKTVNLSAKYMGSTAIIAVYQASQNMYDIFDKVTVLYEGRQIYFGRTEDAKKFFVDMGFRCPDRQTTADFLTSLTNPAERKARPGFASRVPQTPDEFARMWRESLDHKRLLTEIDQFNGEFALGGPQLDKFRQSRTSVQAKGLGTKSPYTISVPMQIKLCLTRGFQRLRGDMSLLISNVIGNLVFALIVSSIFFNLPADTSSFYSRGALLFYAILTNAFSSALEILTLYEQRPIVEKHSRMALYHPFCEAISSMICDLPSKILTAIPFNLVLYFMTNLRRTPGHFFIFFLFSFVCTLTMSMIFRTIGASTRTISQAMAPAAIVMVGLVIYTGFTIPIVDMHPWFKWINNINPIGYAFESLMLNEFFGREFPCVTFIPEGPGYTNVTGAERICATTGAAAGSNVVEGGAYLATSFSYFESHLWRNFGILIVFMVFFLITALLATEYITAAKSKGEVLVFRRGHIQAETKSRANDEESAPGPAYKSDSSTPALHPVRRNADDVSGLQQQTAIFQWEDVCYDINIKGGTRRLLDHVDGWVQPGTLTALMGASGAGKTTLLDTLASRVTTGVVTGDMFVDGQELDESFQRKTGYAQQQDLHLPTSTVREALIFSARLRQPEDVPDVEKVAYCTEVIRLLGMEKYADAVVGVPGEGLNVKQRKRLTIGVELAAKPKLLLFLDEPTSGLDSQTAWSICTLLRELANNGQAILCTIHQPSALLFQEFDRLLFLASGGRTVYFGDIGPNSRTLISYFESQGAKPCPPDANPAEWMLHVIGAAPGAVAERDYADAWRKSDEYVAMKKALARRRQLSYFCPQPTTDEKRKYNREFAAPFQVQFVLCLYRVFQQYYRTPSYIYSKAFLCVTTALFIGFTFFKSDNTLQGLQNQMFSVFMLLTIFTNLVNQIMPHFVAQRSLYEARERPSKAYSWIAFMLSNICVELPWNTVMSFFMYFTWYYPIGLYRNAEPTGTVTERGLLLFLLLWSFMMFTSTFTHMIIASMDPEQAGNIGTLLFSMSLLFCGVLVSPSALPRFWIFMYRVSPFTYLVDAMLSVSLANAPAHCSSIEVSVFNPPSGQTCGEYLAAFMSFAGGSLANPNATSECEFCIITNTNVFLAEVNSFFSHRWRNFGLMWVYVVFNICCALFFYWLGRVPRNMKNVKKN